MELRSCALDRAALERRSRSEGEWNLGDSKGDHHWFLMGCCVVGMDVDQNGQKKMSYISLNLFSFLGISCFGNHERDGEKARYFIYPFPFHI